MMRADDSGLDPVMPGFMPGIHDFLGEGPKSWMAGTSPAMTSNS